MGLEDCIDEIMAIWEKLGIDPATMSRDDAKALLEGFNDIAKRLNPAERIDGLAAILEVASEQRVFRNQLVELHNKYMSLVQADSERRMDAWIDNLIAKKVPGGKILRNILDVSNTNVRATVSNLVAARRMQAVGGLEVRLKAEGLMGYFTDKHSDGDIIRAYEAISKGQAVPEHIVPEVKRVAEIMHEHANVIMRSLSKSGSYYANSYQFLFGLRGLSPTSLVNVSEDLFISRMVDEVGIDMAAYKMMDTGVPIEEYLRKVYAKIKDREFLKAPVGKFDGEGGGVVRERYRNLAAETSSQLNLPLSADSYIKFKEIFLEGSSAASVVYENLDKYGRAWGLMESLGPVPERTLKQMEARLSREFGVGGGRSEAMEILKELTGEANIPENVTMSRLFSAGKMFTSVIRLSAGVFSQVTDIPIKMAVLNTATGQHALTTLNNHLGSLILESPLFSNASKAQRRLLAQRLLVPIDNFNKNIVAESMGATYQPGLWGKIMETGFNMNGMGLFDRAGRMAESETLANAAAELALGSKGYDDMVVTLSNYGIEGADVARLKDAIVKVDGVRYVVPDRIQNATLQGKYASMLLDIRNISTPTPGAGEKALLRAGSRKGTWSGEIWGLFTQFKAFPLTVTRKVMPRIKADKGVAGVITTSLGMIAFAMLGDQLRQMARGKEGLELIDYTNITNVSNLLIRSGFAGLYGDILFNRYTDHTGSLSERMLGPLGGIINDTASLYSSLTTGLLETGKVDFGALGRKAVDYTPFINLWYFQWAMENSLQYAIMEAAHPGSSAQSARAVEKVTGQGVGPFGGSLLEFTEGR